MVTYLKQSVRCFLLLYSFYKMKMHFAEFCNYTEYLMPYSMVKSNPLLLLARKSGRTEPCLYFGHISFLNFLPVETYSETSSSQEEF